MYVDVEHSFEELFRDQYPRLVAFGLSMTGSVEVARDLAQDTMSRAHQNWETLSAADVPAAWLTRVMRNLVIDHGRRQHVESNAIERLSRHVDAVADVVVESRLDDMLAVLPERQRVVVAMVYCADYSIAETAAALGIAQGTVKATLWKARRSIGRYLEGGGDDA